MYIYLIRFFSNFALAGFYPFMAVWLLDTTPMSSFHISLIISVGIFMSRLGSAVFSKFVNESSKKYCILSATIMLMVVIAAMYLSKSFGIGALSIWLLLAALWGVFISVITLAILALVADSTTGEEQKKEFSYVNISLNLSAGLGPIAGSTALAYNPELLPLVPIVALIFSIIFTFFIPTKDPVSKNKEHQSEGDKKNREQTLLPFIVLCILNFLTFISYSHFVNIFPRYADDYIDQRMVGSIFFIASMVMVFMQIPMNKLTVSWKNYQTIMLANLFSAIGTVGLAVVKYDAVVGAMLAAILLALSMVLYVPLYQALAVKLFYGSATYALTILTVTWGLAEGLSVIMAFYLIEINLGDLSYAIGTFSTVLAILLVWIYRDKLE